MRRNPVSYTHLRAHETRHDLVCRLLLEKNVDHRDLHLSIRRQRQMCIRDNPMRGINRLLDGKSFRVTDKEVYEKEPLNISLYAGMHRIYYKLLDIGKIIN